MSEIRGATAGNLLDAPFAASVEVAIQDGIGDGERWLATSVDRVRRFPESVRWKRVANAELVGAEVSVQVDGDLYAQAPSYTIVVRDAPPPGL
ncbi:hypothetical protein [Phytohabitans houttuyneae]|uniref:Uncharacterized protein n=1 Tax=Phytohabitans houttuyneae TaxID=1076126 RepID=A0A6V8KAM1_9ACTN|nr:hypothetical protein [Phytohabitans houttuyneae]GFJ79428.1 hypothetical protein Phou_036080 [Phytohabitans houttuyneae]